MSLSDALMPTIPSSSRLWILHEDLLQLSLHCIMAALYALGSSVEASFGDSLHMPLK